MSTEHAHETVTAFLRDLGQRGPFARHLAADVTFTALDTGRVIAGRAAVERFIRCFKEGAFDARARITFVVADAGLLLLEGEFAGTHIGDFRGVAATGRAVRVPIRLLFTVRDGAITAMRGHLPTDQIMRQIGAAPAEVSRK